MTWRVPLAGNSIGEDEQQAVADVLASGQITMGKRVAEFEQVVAADYGVADAVMVNSGSSANLLALAVAMEPEGNRTLRAGDEVICPAVTWPTGIWPVIQLGMTPVLVDVDPYHLGLAPDCLEPALTGRTKAVFAAHLLGNPAPAAEYAAFCKEFGLELIEDCCEALDVTLDERPVGTFGRFGTLSFYLSHHISTIEGGMLLCRDAQDASIARSLRNHGMIRHMAEDMRVAKAESYPDIDPRFLFLTAGWNLRPMELQAAIGLVQWRKRGPWIERRRAIAATLTAAVELRDDLFRAFRFAPGAVPFAFPILSHARRNETAQQLEAAGIETRPILAGNVVHQPALFHRNAVSGIGMSGAEYLHEHGTYIGLYPQMTNEDAEFVADELLAGVNA